MTRLKFEAAGALIVGNGGRCRAGFHTGKAAGTGRAAGTTGVRPWDAVGRPDLQGIWDVGSATPLNVPRSSRSGVPHQTK